MKRYWGEAVVVNESIEGGVVQAVVKRQRRSAEEKRRIVEATMVPGASIARVAREPGVNANQVFGWRKRYRDVPPAAAVKAAPRLVPVMVTPERDAAAARPPSTAAETIEIDLGDYRVRVGSAVDAQALRRVLDVLERR